MSEILEGPGVPDELVRQQWAVYHVTVRHLAQSGGLTLRGLDQVRRELRPGGIWTEQTIPVGFEQQRSLLLNDVAELIARTRGEGFEDYYRGAGDMLPGSPDDLSEIEP